MAVSDTLFATLHLALLAGAFLLLWSLSQED